jgi:hypothetical protein
MTRTPIRLPADDTITITWREAYDMLLADATSHRTMTPLHPQWNGFLDALWAHLGGTLAEMSRNCLGRESFPIARALLTTFRCNVKRSLLTLNALGGYCDCTILMNAAEVTPDNFPSMVESALHIWSGEPVPPPPRIPRTPIHAPEEDAR